MIEPSRHDGNLCAETASNLVGDRERQQEICSAGVDVFGYGQDRTEVIRRVAQPSDREIGVEHIGVAHHDSVEKRGLIHRCSSAPDECGCGASAELLGLLADWRDELTVQCTDGTGNAVQHIALQQRPRLPGQICLPSAYDEEAQMVHNVLM